MASPYMPNLPTLGAAPNKYAMLADHYQKVYGGQPGTPANPSAGQGSANQSTGASTVAQQGGPTWPNSGKPFMPGQYGTKENPQPQGYWRQHHWYQSGPGAGPIYIPPEGYRPKGWLPAQFPGQVGPGQWYAGENQRPSWVDYGSRSWYLATQIHYGPDDPRGVWNYLPDSWKADLAGWDATYRDRYLMALGSAQPEEAAQIKADYFKFVQGQKQQTQYAAQQAAVQKPPTNPAPYVV